MKLHSSKLLLWYYIEQKKNIKTLGDCIDKTTLMLMLYQPPQKPSITEISILLPLKKLGSYYHITCNTGTSIRFVFDTNECGVMIWNDLEVGTCKKWGCIFGFIGFIMFVLYQLLSLWNMGSWELYVHLRLRNILRTSCKNLTKDAR